MQWSKELSDLQLGILQQDEPLVSVVIPCYNHARFLAEAIESTLTQTYPHVEIIVVDDGSTDNTAEVAAQYPGVHYVRQQNQGLSAARNAGLRESHGDILVFLDADDRLLPKAVEQGVCHLLNSPDSAFVSGRYRYIAEDGSIMNEPGPERAEPDSYTAFLRINYVGMHATVTYRRTVIEAEGGFDPSLPACEDYDLYLRIARKYPVSVHENLVAEYRQHGQSMSRDPRLMLKTVLAVLGSNWRYARENNSYKKAYKAGVKYWREYYSRAFFDHITRQWSHGLAWQALNFIGYWLRYAPRQVAGYFFWGIVGAAARKFEKFLPLSVHWFLAIRGGEDYIPAVGKVRFGDFRRLTPVSQEFGDGRGLPIDRYYVEVFLEHHSADIHGRVLEVGDDSYTRKYGGQRVTKRDILHVVEGNPSATIIADLTRADHIPSDCFDCIILTQTLHLVYDVRAAIETLWRILKPGGVLLATFPGISQTSIDQWADTWYWSFTVHSARRLFHEVFPAKNVEIQFHGNVMAATSFLQGLAAEELHQNELDHSDPHYQMLITVRAVKPEGMPE